LVRQAAAEELAIVCQYCGYGRGGGVTEARPVAAFGGTVIQDAFLSDAGVATAGRLVAGLRLALHQHNLARQGGWWQSRGVISDPARRGFAIQPADPGAVEAAVEQSQQVQEQAREQARAAQRADQAQAQERVRTEPALGKWTAEESTLFQKGLSEHGKDWKQIHKMLPARTLMQVRTHAQKLFEKVERHELLKKGGGNEKKQASAPRKKANRWNGADDTKLVAALRTLDRVSSGDAGMTDWSEVCKALLPCTGEQTRCAARRYLDQIAEKGLTASPEETEMLTKWRPGDASTTAMDGDTASARPVQKRKDGSCGGTAQNSAKRRETGTPSV
jgi:SHAQKYF class myb-like DNA-binding protein